MLEADICIIGAGIMGSAAAHWLCKNHSLKVILLDKHTLSNDQCSSNDANRVFRYAYGKNTFYTEMAVESRKLWTSFERETGETLLVPSGLLMLMGEDEESNSFNRNSFQILTEKGLGAEWLEPRDLKKRFPQFIPSEAVLDPNGGALLASKALRLLSSQAKQNGLQVLENTQATKVASEGRTVVKLKNRGEVHCRKVIVAAGPWSNLLRRESMVEITATRQQVVYLDPGTRIDDYNPSKFPVFFSDKHYGLPAAGIEGVKVSHKGVWAPVDPNGVHRAVDPAAVEECRKVCQRILPELVDRPVLSSKVCLYDMTKDSDFVIGLDPENSNAVYGYGFSGHGFKFAILIGKLLAELATGKPTSFDLARFSPSRAVTSSAFPVA